MSRGSNECTVYCTDKKLKTPKFFEATIAVFNKNKGIKINSECLIYLYGLPYNCKIVRVLSKVCSDGETDMNPTWIWTGETGRVRGLIKETVFMETHESNNKLGRVVFYTNSVMIAGGSIDAIIYDY